MGLAVEKLVHRVLFQGVLVGSILQLAVFGAGGFAEECSEAVLEQAASRDYGDQGGRIGYSGPYERSTEGAEFEARFSVRGDLQRFSATLFGEEGRLEVALDVLAVDSYKLRVREIIYKSPLKRESDEILRDTSGELFVCEGAEVARRGPPEAFASIRGITKGIEHALRTALPCGKDVELQFADFVE